MLGALLPLLVVFYRRCLEGIAGKEDGPREIAIEARHEVEVDRQVRRCVAYGAMERLW